MLIKNIFSMLIKKNIKNIILFLNLCFFSFTEIIKANMKYAQISPAEEEAAMREILQMYEEMSPEERNELAEMMGGNISQLDETMAAFKENLGIEDSSFQTTTNSPKYSNVENNKKNTNNENSINSNKEIIKEQIKKIAQTLILINNLLLKLNEKKIRELFLDRNINFTIDIEKIKYYLYLINDYINNTDIEKNNIIKYENLKDIELYCSEILSLSGNIEGINIEKKEDDINLYEIYSVKKSEGTIGLKNKINKIKDSTINKIKENESEIKELEKNKDKNSNEIKSLKIALKGYKTELSELINDLSSIEILSIENNNKNENEFEKNKITIENIDLIINKFEKISDKFIVEFEKFIAKFLPEQAKIAKEATENIKKRENERNKNFKPTQGNTITEQIKPSKDIFQKSKNNDSDYIENFEQENSSRYDYNDYDYDDSNENKLDNDNEEKSGNKGSSSGKIENNSSFENKNNIKSNNNQNNENNNYKSNNKENIKNEQSKNKKINNELDLDEESILFHNLLSSTIETKIKLNELNLEEMQNNEIKLEKEKNDNINDKNMKDLTNERYNNTVNSNKEIISTLSQSINNSILDLKIFNENLNSENIEKKIKDICTEKDKESLENLSKEEKENTACGNENKNSTEYIFNIIQSSIKELENKIKENTKEEYKNIINNLIIGYKKEYNNLRKKIYEIYTELSNGGKIELKEITWIKDISKKYEDEIKKDEIKKIEEIKTENNN